MINLYKKAIEKIQTEIDKYYNPECRIHEVYYLDAIESALVDLEEKLKELDK